MRSATATERQDAVGLPMSKKSKSTLPQAASPKFMCARVVSVREKWIALDQTASIFEDLPLIAGAFFFSVLMACDSACFPAY